MAVKEGLFLDQVVASPARLMMVAGNDLRLILPGMGSPARSVEDRTLHVIVDAEGTSVRLGDEEIAYLRHTL
jgi:hypothetical protein